MRRRSLDVIVSVTGLIMAIVLAGAGVLFMIGVHVLGIADGRTYSEVSGEWTAATKATPVDDAQVAALGQARTALFMGETLRGMLLNAYAFWTLGTIAIVAAWVSWTAAALLLVLALLGFAHAGSTPETAAVFEPKASTNPSSARARA